MPRLVLKSLESAVLVKLLAGDHPVLVTLRAQLERLSVSKREYSGVGFFTHFSVDESLARAPVSKLRFGDVQAVIDGLQHGAGFVLYVDDGFLVMLEGYSYDEEWPAVIGEFSLSYVDSTRKSTRARLGQ